MKIVSFYHPLHPPREAEDRELIALWAESWQKHGWDAQVVGMDHARKHSDFEWFNALVSKHPTVNGGEYDRICHLRHLAFDVAYLDEGAALFSDYDVINYGWRPNPEAHVWKAQCHSFMNRHPALYMARGMAFDWIFHHLSTWAHPDIINGKPHISDQTVFMNLPMSESKECIDYPDPGWDTSLLTHYGNERVGAEQKAQKIRALRAI